MNSNKKVLFLIFIFVLIIYSSYKENNYLVISNKYSDSLNNNFVDDNFYKCIVDTYNNNTASNISYETELKDTQLSSIGLLNCQNKDISDVSGLSKLTNLQILYLNNNKISSIDLSNNTLLTTLALGNNNLNEIDISKNTQLEYIYLQNNNLSKIDLTKNSKVFILAIDGNKLSNIDISNNSLAILSIENNSFSKHLGIYKSEMYNLDNNFTDTVKFKSNVNVSLDSISSGSSLINIIDNKFSFDTTGIYNVTGSYHHNIGGKNNFDINYFVYVIDATSDKYIINGSKGYIYTGLDNNDNILDNININYGDMTISDNKLIIKYNDNIVKEFMLVNIKTSYDIVNDNINVIGSINLDNISILNGSARVNGNYLEVLYSNEVIYKYYINYIDIGLDIKDNYIYLDPGTIVDNIISKITTGTDIKVVNANDEVITSNNKIGSGYKLIIDNNKYTFVVKGDVTGDGDVTMADVMKCVNQLFNNNTINEDYFLEAGDVTLDGTIKMNDVMKLANYVLKGGIL